MVPEPPRAGQSGRTLGTPAGLLSVNAREAPMASPSVVYAFAQNRVQRQLAFTRVTEALYTMLIDVQRRAPSR
jgi:hypothetical protein